VEGEGDALAAESAKAISPAGSTVHALGVVALPGAGVAHAATESDLLAAGCKAAIMALDADQAGRKAAAKLGTRLTAAGVSCLLIELAEGEDLADMLAASPDRSLAFANALRGAVEFTQPAAPPKPKTALRSHYRASRFSDRDERQQILDRVRETPAEIYLPALAGVEPLPGGRCRCPLPEHEDLSPSASYRRCDWYCHPCGVGGGPFDLAAALTGLSLSGPDFWQVVAWAADRLSINPDAIRVHLQKGGPPNDGP
jgi:hypothetical protein